jgi:hypothetical protein
MKENYDNQNQLDKNVENEIENKFQELLGRSPDPEEIGFVKGGLKDGYTVAEVGEEFIKPLDEYKKLQEKK